MKTFIIKNLEDVEEAMYDEIAINKKENVTFVGFYEDAIEVLKELMMHDEIVPYSLEIHPAEYDGYDKEYYVTLDNEMSLFCEPAYHVEHEIYYFDECDIAFIRNDVNSAILARIEADELYEVTYTDEVEDDKKPYCGECCGECCCEDRANATSTSDNRSVTTKVVKDDDGRVRGFEKTWVNHENGKRYFTHYEHYTNNEVLL